jgi:hypothetical protein
MVFLQNHPEPTKKLSPARVQRALTNRWREQRASKPPIQGSFLVGRRVCSPSLFARSLCLLAVRAICVLQHQRTLARPPSRCSVHVCVPVHLYSRTYSLAGGGSLAIAIGRVCTTLGLTFPESVHARERTPVPNSTKSGPVECMNTSTTSPHSLAYVHVATQQRSTTARRLRRTATRRTSCRSSSKRAVVSTRPACTSSQGSCRWKPRARLG